MDNLSDTSNPYIFLKEISSDGESTLEPLL